MREAVIERLRERAAKRGWSPDKLQAKIEAKTARRERAVEGIQAIVGIASTIVGAAPLGATVGVALDKLVPQSVLNKVPLVKDLAAEGVEAFAASKLSNESVAAFIAKDIVPMWHAIEDGEYGKAAVGIAPVVAVAAQAAGVPILPILQSIIAALL